MLGEIELQQVQKIETDEDQVLTQHGVPALEGDFLQGVGRRATRVELSGVMTGAEAAGHLKTLRDTFRGGAPVSFVADIATATKVDQVLVEELGVRELAGRPQRFEYELTLRELIPPPRPEIEEPPPPPPPPPPPAVETGTLVVEVLVEGEPDFDFSAVRVTVEGTTEEGSSLSRTLTNRTNNVWEEVLPPGRYMARAVSNPQGSALAEIRPAQTTRVTIVLRSVAGVAKTFVVHFRFDKAFVEPCLREVLRQVAARAESTDEKLLIVGHTDKVDTRGYNQSLSERRARAVFAFLNFGNDRQAAIDEWDSLRQRRVPPGEQPTIEDRWGTREYQHILQDLGFYPGRVDGNHGPLTDEAVRAYRCHKGLPPGTQVDDEVWRALIEDYLAQDNLGVPAERFFPNCSGEILKWLGCGEDDPVNSTLNAHRPNRRVELLFVRADVLPCAVPRPDTFDLPRPGGVNDDWCVGPPSGGSRLCFVTPHLDPETRQPQPCSTVPGGPWCREPVDPRTIAVQGSIEHQDGSPAPNQTFVIITPKGEFLQSEDARGEAIAARTDANGNFRFSDKPVGVYSLEMQAPVLVRLKDEGDDTVKGNAVCKVLQADSDRLDVVIVDAPLLREIRLPVVAHLMTALHPVTREVRTCPAAIGPPGRQATAITDAELRAAFEEANRIWRQARIRFELDDVNIVREAYAFRTECEVDESEFTILLERCAYPDVVNVFLVGDLAGLGEAGFGVSPEGGAVLGVAGCALGDRFQTTVLGPPLSVTLDTQQRAQVLAHELGHFLNLGHVDDTSVNAGRLMLAGTLAGTNRTLTQDEANRARVSRGATDDCVPLSLQVTGATQVGASLSNRFIVIQNPTGVVTVDAQIADRLVAPGVGTLVMTGGDPGSNDRQRIVNAASSGVTDIVATYVPTGGGQPVVARTVIRVATFRLDVIGARRVGGTGSTTFVAVRDPIGVATVVAVIDPAPFCVPGTLVSWTGGREAADPLRRAVVLDPVGSQTITATIAGRALTVTINVFVPQLDVINTAGPNVPVATFVRCGLWDNAFDTTGTVFNEAAEPNNFAGADSRRFHLRVNDPTKSGHVDVEWRTLSESEQDLDPPASKTVSLVETAPSSGIFISRGLLLVTDADDQNQPTHSGLPPSVPDGGLIRNRNESNHRIRRASLSGSMVAVYNAGSNVVRTQVSVFQRNPEQRRKLPLQIFVLRVAPGGAGVIPTAPGSPVWDVELRQIRETYERLGIKVETAIARGTPVADIVRNGSDALVLIQAPAGVNPNNVSLADEATLGKAFPPLPATIRMFYAGGLASLNRGEAWPDHDFSGQPQQAAAFLNRVAPTYNAAHEIGHILTDKASAANGGHYNAPTAPPGNRLHANQNLMRNGTSVVEGVSQTKRLWDASDQDGTNQFTSIRNSRYTRNF
jgi:outer membrane protein OmpA-like peptidoglycan-associated protein